LVVKVSEEPWLAYLHQQGNNSTTEVAVSIVAAVPHATYLQTGRQLRAPARQCLLPITYALQWQRRQVHLFSHAAMQQKMHGKPAQTLTLVQCLPVALKAIAADQDHDRACL
jgi:hypothetical protein